MHAFPKKSSLTNRLRRALAGICLGLLVVSLGLTPVAQMQKVTAALATFDCGNVTEIPQVECEALVALYESTAGPSWIRKEGWLETNIPCSWYGVSCDQGTVTSINLYGVCDSYYGCGSFGITVSLPPEIGNLTNLITLSLDNIKLTYLPPEIGNLSNLMFLGLGNNQLSSLPPEFYNLTNLTYLDLSYNQITSLSPEFGNFRSLKYLEMGSNQLASLPPEFGNLSRLDLLNLSNNRLSSLPPEFGNLSNLWYLDLSYNQLSSLPPEFGNLSNFNWLDLSNNQLSSLLPEFGNLSNIWYLDLSSNQLANLPPEFGNLFRLNHLDLSNNQLTSLPPEICNITNLRFGIDVSYNRLSFLDPCLSSPDDWEDTQTIPPSDLQLHNVMPTGLELGWTPIRYTTNGGYYEVSFATDPNGPFTVHGTTADKTNADYQAGSLPARTTYYVRIRTYSQALNDQVYDLWSEYSPAIAILSTPIDPVSGASLEYTNEQGLAATIEVPPGVVDRTGTFYFSTKTDIKLPPILAFTGRAFNLGIYQDDSYTDDLLLTSPITLTLENDESRWNEENLELIFWEPTTNTWIDATQTCSPRGAYDRRLDENQLVVNACRLGKYALVDVRSTSYLPVVTQHRYLP
jgi:hypothetical protein